MVFGKLKQKMFAYIRKYELKFKTAIYTDRLLFGYQVFVYPLVSSTGWPRSYRKYILQITQPSQYIYAKLLYRFTVTSGSPSILILVWLELYFFFRFQVNRLSISKHFLFPTSLGPLWYSNLRYKMGQDFFDRQFLI